GEACQEFITAAGRNMQVIYEQTNAHGQTASAVGSSWA
ncbi:type VII secretion protein EsxI, partial [Mycobacterium kansasii]